MLCRFAPPTGGITQDKKMPAQRYTLIYVLLMTLVVVASNILVQFPVQGTLGPINLADILTYGAFTYPFAFLVTDLTNRQFGPKIENSGAKANEKNMTVSSTEPRSEATSGARHQA